MRVKGFTALLAAAVLAALAGWTMVEPISTGLYAQAAPAQGGRGAPAPGARGAVPPRSAGPGPRTRRAAANPGTARRRPAAGRRPVLLEELLQGPGELARQALLPLQQPAPAVRDVGLGQRIGPKPPESASWGNCNDDWPRERIVSPYPYKTAKEHYEALMAAGQGEGRPDGLHEGHRARLGRLLRAATTRPIAARSGSGA